MIRSSHSHILSIAYQQENPGFPQSDSPLLQEAKKQLEAYFNKKLQHFDLPLATDGFPQFYQDVWKLIKQVPSGHTASYSALAAKMGDLNMVRAIGQANARNPFPIIIPCHRIIGKNKNLTGYIYGIEVKRW